MGLFQSKKQADEISQQPREQINQHKQNNKPVVPTDEQTQKMIRVAAIFLGMKQVENYSRDQIQLFLKGKGLTTQMIQQAFQKRQEYIEKRLQIKYPGIQKLPPPSLQNSTSNHKRK